jgi:hypothetical protein
MSRPPSDRFLVVRNPDPETSLPYLVHLPVDGGLVLKVRAPWPTTARVYCHAFDGGWPDPAELVEDVAVVLCRRRGPAIDLVLDRPPSTPTHPTVCRRPTASRPTSPPSPPPGSSTTSLPGRPARATGANAARP